LRAILVTSRDETISASIAGDAEDAKGGDGSAPFGHLRALCLRDRHVVDRDDRRLADFPKGRSPRSSPGREGRIKSRVGSGGHAGGVDRLHPAMCSHMWKPGQSRDPAGHSGVDRTSQPSRTGTERCYGAGGEEMAPSSLHLTDGVPRCPSRTT
jgi:hypothetical protein